jgi:anti-sigma factor RsiW
VNCQEAEALLNPYVDGELDVASSLRIEEHISTCASCGQQHRDLEELRREIAGSALDYTPSPALERRIARVTRQPQPIWKSPALFAAAAAAAIFVLVMVRTEPGGAGEAVDSHVRSLMASHLVDVPSSDHHTVKPWFQGKISFSPAVPELGASGFVLTGGRLDMVRGAPAAAIVYKRREHVINLFVQPARGGDSSPRARSTEGYNVEEWTKGGMRYWAVSDLNATELREFARLASTSP